jgi:sigma-B regulation protein RsbU (phosphoserine phosphatase)
LQRAYLTEETSGRRVEVDTPITIGRTKECALIIDDTSASRRHVEITPRGGRYYWKDLGSTNGTIVNGRPMLGGELKNGDRIQIGETVIRFEAEGEVSAVPAPPSRAADSGLFQETILDELGQEHPAGDLGKSAALLEAVYAVNNEIATNYDRDDLMDHILAMTMRAINAQRGAIFFANADGTLRNAPECVRVAGTKTSGHDDVRISQTVAKRVLMDGKSVLFKDNDQDGGLNPTASIMSLSLRSIVCVPLRAKDRILGILYIDTDRPDQTYAEDDLLLAAAVGNSAGLALENARMHREMLDKQRMEQEIQTAWTIQEGFLVKEWPEGERRFQVYGETRPAKTVGGDFYDFVRPNKRTAGILIGDVSGKGVPAALTMAQLLAEFRLLVRDCGSPAELLAHMNADFCKRSQRGTFCTLCYVAVDLDNGVVQSANAGHHPVMLVSKRGYREFGSASGAPLGILAEARWENHVERIEPGDTLLLYTDGIVEATSMTTTHDRRQSHGLEQYDVGNLGIVAKAHYGHQPQVLLNAINNDVLRFCAPGQPHDDCTMIAMRYLGSST